MTTTTAIPTGAKMPFDFEEIIKVPFTMKPYFQVYSNEDMQNDISRYTKYPALITDILKIVPKNLTHWVIEYGLNLMLQ